MTILAHLLDEPKPAPPDDRRQGGGRPGAAATPRPAAEEGPVGPILIVEDDPALLAAVSEALEDEGYAVVAVRHGRAALEAILRRRPSLVLLDMRLPIMNGWELARELRAREIHLSIVVMTAAQDAAAWAAEIGAAGHLAKPFDLHDLLATVERLRERTTH
jgi:DNA-binding response OmpR family regulator